ncbi:MAG TPA: diaminopimelate epimerase [Gemmatimonadaceae bacterium]|nr:diaminopimelate epimerase [Gemmatimonadaceae bacterium]
MRFGTPFFKLSGSGNDFIAFDEMRLAPAERPAWAPETIRALCRRGTGVGADGIFLLRPSADTDYELVYFNSDGSRAALCGNASLCSIRLAVELGYARPGALRFTTDDGVLTGRLAADGEGMPEFDFAPPSLVEPDRADLRDGASAVDERALGHAVAGVPHVVVLCADADAVDLLARAPRLRHHPALPHGANVDFVSQAGERWRIRTFERGVEGETLACGTGSVASALLLAAWGAAGDGRGGASAAATPIEFATSSGEPHRVRLTRLADGRLQPSLAGGAGIVYRGELGEGPWGHLGPTTGG